jgi:hypothetical protein
VIRHKSPVGFLPPLLGDKKAKHGCYDATMLLLRLASRPGGGPKSDSMQGRRRDESLRNLGRVLFFICDEGITLLMGVTIWYCLVVMVRGRRGVSPLNSTLE